MSFCGILSTITITLIGCPHSSRWPKQLWKYWNSRHIWLNCPACHLPMTRYNYTTEIVPAMCLFKELILNAVTWSQTWYHSHVGMDDLDTFTENCHRLMWAYRTLWHFLKAQRTPGNALFYGSIISLIVSSRSFLEIIVNNNYQFKSKWKLINYQIIIGKLILHFCLLVCRQISHFYMFSWPTVHWLKNSQLIGIN